MSIKINITNDQLSIGDIRIVGVASSSIVLIGDTDSIVSSSTFDAPPESVIVGPFVPLAPETSGGR